tara:strand:+ start:86 stop:562 length:477 start_codon:yes stop_codon:yes gene_type:complete
METLLTTLLIFSRFCLVLFKILNLKTAIMTTKTHPPQNGVNNAPIQEELNLNHKDCLKEYQNRVEACWQKIYAEKLHHKPPFYATLNKFASDFGLSFGTVSELYDRLRKNLISSLAMDHYNYEAGFRISKPQNIPTDLFDEVQAEIIRYKKGGRYASR